MRKRASWMAAAMLAGTVVLLGGAGGVSAGDAAPATRPHGGHDAAAEGAGDATHESGVPGFQRDLALWSLVVFLIFVGLMKKFAWGPLVEGLDRREIRIRRDIAEAEAARLKAEKLLAEHAARLDQVQDEVKGILAEARRDAEHTKNDIIATAQREAETTRRRALTEIERARDQALKELFDAAADRIAEATEHVLGRALTPADQERFIQEALAEIGEQQA